MTSHLVYSKIPREFIVKKLIARCIERAPCTGIGIGATSVSGNKSTVERQGKVSRTFRGVSRGLRGILTRPTILCGEFIALSSTARANRKRISRRDSPCCARTLRERTRASGISRMSVNRHRCCCCCCCCCCC